MALFVPDSDSLRFYRAIVAYADDALVAGGRLYLEINPMEANAIRRLLADAGLEEIDVIRDMTGRERFAKARKPSGDE